MKLRFIAVVVCVFAVCAMSACAALGIEICGTGATRCRGNTVQVCKSGFSWSDAMSCDDLAKAEGGAWSCGALKGTCESSFQCVPKPPEKKKE